MVAVFLVDKGTGFCLIFYGVIVWLHETNRTCMVIQIIVRCSSLRHWRVENITTSVVVTHSPQVKPVLELKAYIALPYSILKYRYEKRIKSLLAAEA